MIPNKRYFRMALYTPNVRSILLDAFDMAELAIRFKLPTGEVDHETMATLRDVLNFAGIVSVLTREKLDPEFATDFSQEYPACYEAFCHVFERGLEEVKAKGSTEGVVYKASPEEVNAIVATFDSTMDLLRAQLDEAPQWTTSAYFAMRALLMSDAPRRVHLTEKELIRGMKKAMSRGIQANYKMVHDFELHNKRRKQNVGKN